ncbi:MAG: 4Fe-4S binding protein [Desulfobacteraceae bacterium]|nr:4Fe-4S binding protein [Desulfobacteraceae bacterium]
MNLKEKIQEISALPDGVDLIGVSPIDRFLELPEMGRPTAFLPKAKSVIVIGSQLFQVLTKKLTATRKIGEVSYRDFYNAHNETVDVALKQTGYRIARLLTNQGYASINVGHDLTDYRTITGAFSFKYAGQQAGLGVIGKNGLLLTRAFGPRVRLSAVLTEAPLPCEDVVFEDLCGGCDICYKVCPSGALKAPSADGKTDYDRFVCCSFYTANDGCGLCMSKCPL